MILETTNRFDRDLRRMEKRGKDMRKFSSIVDRLLTGAPLAKKHRLHKLTGGYADRWECHIEPDWLLIWMQNSNVITLERTGGHFDLFG